MQSGTGNPGSPTRAGRRLWPSRSAGAGGLAMLLTVAFTPLPNALSGWMAGTPRLEAAQAIVVLGRGGVDTDGVLSNPSLRRTLHGIELYRRGLAPILVFSGDASEADARAGLARRLGVWNPALMVAAGGHTTYGEAMGVRALLEPRGIRRILLVADPVDMPRTRATFARAGFEVFPAPTRSSGASHPEARLGLFRELCVELTGWVYYRLAGYI